MNARKDYRVEGDPSSHPVWRDDESAMIATRRIIDLARKARRRIHILHVTTPAELEYIARNKEIATCEVTPQHLNLAAEDAYPRLDRQSGAEGKSVSVSVDNGGTRNNKKN